MTQAAALQAFFASFGIDAYPTSDVPDDAVFPWLTYDLVNGGWGDRLSITVNLWYYGDSNVAINAMVQQMNETINIGGVVMPCDGGAIWITKGSPFCQAVRDPSDDRIKRRYINLYVEFLTTY